MSVVSGIIGELSRDHFRDDYIENYKIAQDHTKQLRGAEVRLQHLGDGSVENFRLIEDFANVSVVPEERYKT